MQCPLCKDEAPALQFTLPVADLVGLYRRERVRVAGEFSGIDSLSFYRCGSCDLGFYRPMVCGSENFYRQLQRFEWYYNDHKDEFDVACRYLGGGSILEVGAGKGAFAACLGSDARYVGLELSENAIAMAGSRGVTVLRETVADHAHGHPGEYDAVCAFQVLEHVADTGDFVSACVECVRPGGVLIFSVPAHDSLVSVARNHAVNMPPHHVTCWSDTALERLAGLFPLELVAVHHERLAQNHRRWYARIVAAEALCSVLGYRPRYPVDNRAGYRMISVAASLLGRLLAHGFSSRHLLPRGHSVTAVYRRT